MPGPRGQLQGAGAYHGPTKRPQADRRMHRGEQVAPLEPLSYKVEPSRCEMPTGAPNGPETREERTAGTGVAFRPVTVGAMLDNRIEHVLAYCRATGGDHSGMVDLPGWPSARVVPDIDLRLSYSRCGARRNAQARPSRRPISGATQRCAGLSVCASRARLR